MLILNRQRGEEIFVMGPDGRPMGRIVVASAQWANGKLAVRLGFDFPDDVKILRKEVYDAMTAAPEATS